MNGRLDGPAKYFYANGVVETRIYENGVLQGEGRGRVTRTSREIANFATKKKKIVIAHLNAVFPTTRST